MVAFSLRCQVPLVLLLVAGGYPALAQMAATPSTKAASAPCATGAGGPELPGGGGAEAVLTAIQRLIRYPTCWSEDKRWRGDVSFTVRADGLVGEVKMVRGFSYALDEAVLAAVRQLPRFEPYCCDGQPGAFNFLLPITLMVPAQPHP
ncbi:MAG: energy transducer TonB [Bacteroidota bacterium]|nr:energy transducer TonB [Bacteroidota bacterium]